MVFAFSTLLKMLYTELDAYDFLYNNTKGDTPAGKVEKNRNGNYSGYTAKKMSQIRRLKIVTLIEHLKVFCLHTPSVPDFNTILILNTSCSQIISLEHLVYAIRTLSDVR